MNRLTRSLLFGTLFFGLVITGFFQAPKYFPQVLEFNAKLWQSRETPLSIALPETTEKPRVNGLIGLTNPIELAKYSVMVESGDKKLELKMPELESKAQVSVSTLFKCIEGWSRPVSYSGILFSEFLEMYDLGKKPDGTYYQYVGLETPDREYYVSIDMKSMLHSQTVLAMSMNGQALLPENGAPIRLIIPIKYGIKSLKRIGRIFFSDTRPPDYWNEEGYDWYAGL